MGDQSEVPMRSGTPSLARFNLRKRLIVLPLNPSGFFETDQSGPDPSLSGVPSGGAPRRAYLHILSPSRRRREQ
jgi:hypothetical protein